MNVNERHRERTKKVLLLALARWWKIIGHVKGRRKWTMMYSKLQTSNVFTNTEKTMKKKGPSRYRFVIIFINFTFNFQSGTSFVRALSTFGAQTDQWFNLFSGLHPREKIPIYLRSYTPINCSWIDKIAYLKNCFNENKKERKLIKEKELSNANCEFIGF